ncbi:MAG: autotransporter outer membrane beta-barrel domain-containing protein, partial [Alphaproteobacteria bacterium]
YVDFDDGETNADRNGDQWVISSGLSIQMGANTTVGVLSRYRSGDADSNALAASLDTEAYGGGAYLTTKLGGGLHVSVAALYETGDNDIVISGDTGSFDSEQFTLEGKIDKRIKRGRNWIEPAVSLLYIDTGQDNYTDSSGTLVAGQDLTLGRLTFGPAIGTTIHRGTTQIRPFARVNGVWDFENEGNFTTSTAGIFTSGDTALNLGGGVEIEYASGIAIKLAGDWYSFNSDLEAWSISGGVGAPLSAFGIGSAGTVSLNLTSNAEDASATARIKIPLN